MTHLIRRVQIQPGGWVMMSLLVFLLDLPVFLAIVGNVLIHEFGHLYILLKCGVPVRKITVGFTGLCIQCSLYGISRRAVLVCAASGPICGICAAFFFSFCGNLFDNSFLRLFAGIGMFLSLFNLLPVMPLDGGRILYALMPDTGEYVEAICAMIIFAVGLYVMWNGYGTALACLGIFLLSQRRRKRIAFG